MLELIECAVCRVDEEPQTCQLASSCDQWCCEGEDMKGCKSRWVDVEMPLAHLFDDFAPAIMFKVVALLQAAPEEAWQNLSALESP